MMIYLASSIYLTMVTLVRNEVKDVKASEVLPKFVSEELGNKIIEEANRNFERNIGSRIDYKRSEGGVHGKAKFAQSLFLTEGIK